jgi:hypothetical protein
MTSIEKFEKLGYTYHDLSDHGITAMVFWKSPVGKWGKEMTSIYVDICSSNCSTSGSCSKFYIADAFEWGNRQSADFTAEEITILAELLKVSKLNDLLSAENQKEEEKAL